MISVAFEWFVGMLGCGMRLSISRVDKLSAGGGNVLLLSRNDGRGSFPAT